MGERQESYVCGSCSFLFTVKTSAEPKKPVIFCPSCRALAKNMNSDVPFHETLKFYSNCPNAWHCELVDKYDARTCEDAHLSPRCLTALFQYMEGIDVRLRKIEKSLDPLVKPPPSRKAVRKEPKS
jgi:DNA-directed RNA polymerase subunit RPC12/RpoP